MMLGKFDFQPYYPHLQKFLQYPRILYLEPWSTRSQPFTEWQGQQYSFLTDGFCHSKTFTAKVSAKTQRSVIKIKQSISAHKSNVNLTDEVKLWFDLPNAASLYTKVKSNDYIKVHYDHGLRLYRNNYYYLFGGLNSKNVDFRVGLGFISQNCNSQNRLKIHVQKPRNQYYWYHKTYLAYEKFRFGFLSVFDLNNNVLQKNNLLFGYYFRPETVAYLKAEVRGFRNNNPEIRRPVTIFDTLTANVIHKINAKSRVGVQASIGIQNHSLEQAKAVYQIEYAPKKIIKASINNRLDLGLLIKLPLYGLQDTASLSVGAGLSGLQNKNTNSNVGVQVSVNL